MNAVVPPEKPQPPREPEPGECCQSGCQPCVFDLYWDALERYEICLALWKAVQEKNL